jgi:hypothetical protein
VPWVTINTSASGTGNATIAFSVAANAGAARTGTLDVGGQTFTVNQAGAPQPACSVAIDRNSQSVAVGGTTGVSVAVSAGAGCGWAATSNAAWITITAGATGSGNGKVTFNVAANTGSARTGTLTIGGNAFTVNQAAAAACSYAITPSTQSMSASGGGSSVDVSTANGCPWTATSNAAWLTVSSGASGTGDGKVAVSVAANTGGARTGTLTIAGQTFTVNQAAGLVCSYSIDPVAQSMSAAGGAGTSIAVSTSTGCGWTAASNASWLTITSGSSGTGNGTVAFSAAPNTSASGRAGTLTIAGRTFAVLQAGAAPACTYSISPNVATFGRKSGDGQVTVSAPAGCAWTATSDAGWLTITSGASDTGNGTVKFKVATLTGPLPRTGVLTIAGRTFTVIQTPSSDDD